MYDEAYLCQKLEWVKHRLRALDEMEAKLVGMRKIALLASHSDLAVPIRQELKGRFQGMEKEVNELDVKSRTFWLDCQ